jgi:hypothetical protein
VDKVALKKTLANAEQIFRNAVWTRDKVCRVCQKRVRKTLELVPDRGEVHHLHGRIGTFRLDLASAVLLCAACHQRVQRHEVTVPI